MPLSESEHFEDLATMILCTLAIIALDPWTDMLLSLFFFLKKALTDPNASAAQQAVLQQHINSLTYSPFGDSPLFRNPMSDPKKKEEVNLRVLL